MYKADALVLVHCVDVRRFNTFQIGAQMVAFRGDKTQGIIHIDSGCFADLVTGSAQNGVRSFGFRHGAAAGFQRVGRGNIPAVIRNLCAGGSHNSFRIGDTGTHIFTGAFKYLFAGYRADRRSINLNIQNKVLVQPALHHIQKACRRSNRHNVRKRVQQQRQKLPCGMGKITEFFLADGMGAFIRKFIRNCAEMAYAGANHLERLDDILAQGNDAESKRADDCDKQTGCVHANGRSNFVSTAHSANHDILDPKADHVQGIANQVRVRNTRQYLTEAVMAAGFFCSAPPGVYGQLAAQAVQPEGKTAVSTDRRYRCFILLFSLILLFQMGRICAQKGLLSARKGACMGL